MCCYYPDSLLLKWDSVTNPIGDKCYECDDYECEHNGNTQNEPDFIGEEFDFYDE